MYIERTMTCKHCTIEIVGKPIIVGPKKLGLIYCSRRCNVLETLKAYPETSLAGMLQRMYPEYVEEANQCI